MVTIETIKNEIKNVLSSNIQDPISLRKERGISWIFTNIPKYDVGTPRIQISYITSPFEPIAIGTTHLRHNARFQITIILKETDEIDINGDGEKEYAEYIADYLGNQVIKVIMENQTSFSCWRMLITTQAVLRKDGYYFQILEAEAIVERGN